MATEAGSTWVASKNGNEITIITHHDARSGTAGQANTYWAKVCALLWLMWTFCKSFFGMRRTADAWRDVEKTTGWDAYQRTLQWQNNTAMKWPNAPSYPSDKNEDEDETRQVYSFRPGDQRVAMREDNGEEDLGRYVPGGLHLVRIGDRFDGDRYEVLRKLGHGRHSTVWLVRDSSDNNKFLAMKMLEASASDPDSAEKHKSVERETLRQLKTKNPQHGGHRFINHLVADFEHQGPNGTHVGLLFEPMGETLSTFPKWFSDSKPMPGAIIKRFAVQMLMAVQCAHESGVVHCDIRPDKVFVRIKDTLRIEKFFLPLTEPSVERQRPEEAYRIVKSTPLRNFYFGDFEECLELEVCLGDFGSASLCRDEQPCMAVPLASHCAPEMILGATLDHKVDLWSLGACVFAVWRGQRLFDDVFGAEYSADFHLLQMQQLFGDNENNDDDDDDDDNNRNNSSNGSKSFPRSLLTSADPVQREQWFDTDGRVRGYESVGVPDQADDGWMGRRMEARERAEFVSWLHCVMKLDPRERPSVGEVGEHPWLRDVEAG